jgi:phosphocarrier protein
LSQRAEITAKICNRLGLHARPAMSFVDLATEFKSAITVERTDQNPAERVDGKSIMQMMMLAATRGTELCIRAEGPDAPEACKRLKALIESGFDED